MDGHPTEDALQAFTQGFFEVLEPLLSLSIAHSQEPPLSWTSRDHESVQSRYPIVMEAGLQGGGAVFLLLTLKDALRMAGMVFGNADKATDRLAEHDLATLRELGTHAIGGGLERVAAAMGRPLALEDVQVSLGGPRTAQRLGALPVPGTVRIDIRFSAPPELDGDAVLLAHGDVFAFDLPGAARDAEPAPSPPIRTAAATAGGADEIFAELTPRKERTMAQADGAAKGGVHGPSNLDMILDIRLVVRARLGRVEMPIGEILGLGPGSIVEVGRTLDEPVELLVNDKLIARGDVVVVDEKFGLRITEIVSPRERIESLI